MGCNDKTMETTIETASVKRTIRFECSAPDAESVAVAGTFNGWAPENGLMEKQENGRWLKELQLEPGSYEYCIVVDGVYHPDPRSSQTTLTPFGGENSILEVVR